MRHRDESNEPTWRDYAWGLLLAALLIGTYVLVLVVKS